MKYTEWIDDIDALAIRLSARQARRFLDRKDLVVPEDCVCLLDGDQRALLPAGGRRDVIEDLTLLKEALFLVETSVDDITSQDGHVYGCQLRFTAYIDTRSEEQAERFRRMFLAAPDTICYREDLLAELEPRLQNALREFAEQRPSDKLDDEGVDEDIERFLRNELKGFFEDSGIELSRVRTARFHSEALEALRRQQAEVQLEADKARARQRKLEIWEKDQKGQLLAEQEVKDFYEQLKREGQIKEIGEKQDMDQLYLQYEAQRQKEQQGLSHMLQEKERDHKLQLDRKEFEAELERTKLAAEMLGGANVAALISQVDDADAKERLYRYLIQKDMSPEQIQAQSTAGGMNKRMEEAYSKLLQAAEQLASRPSKRLAAIRPQAEEGDARTHRVLVASGRRVLAFDPKSNVQADQAREIYDFSSGTLGGIRSVRVRIHDGQKYLVAGARGGVYATPLRGPTDPAGGKVTEYAFSAALQGRTGVNAIELIGDRLLVTHSECGLISWEFGKPHVPEQRLFPETTAGASSVRGLTSREGRIYYASENRVYAADMNSDHPVPLLYSGPTSQVTSVVLQAGRLYAATVDGAIYSWDPEDPHSPTRVLHQQAKIYMIRPARIGGVPHLFVGSKDRGVLCRYMEGALDTKYQSGSLVRWADGAADFCFGVDYDSHQLIIWRAQFPESELRRIPLAEPINDIWVVHKDVV